MQDIDCRFIDIHTHVLPGVDDGAADFDESLRMLRAACDAGTIGIIATPHALPGASQAADRFSSLHQELEMFARKASVKVKLAFGAEYSLDWGLVEEAEQRRLITLAGTNCVLLELPFTQLPDVVWTVVFHLRLHGYQPIIAHPERSLAVQRDLTMATKLVEAGCLLQVNSGSLYGVYGRKTKSTVFSLLDSKLVFCVASDMHAAGGNRGPNLKKAYSLVSARLGADHAKSVFLTGPSQIFGEHL
jgi:protein-tyrosine phosphatase